MDPFDTQPDAPREPAGGPGRLPIKRGVKTYSVNGEHHLVMHQPYSVWQLGNPVADPAAPTDHVGTTDGLVQGDSSEAYEWPVMPNAGEQDEDKRDLRRLLVGSIQGNSIAHTVWRSFPTTGSAGAPEDDERRAGWGVVSFEAMPADAGLQLHPDDPHRLAPAEWDTDWTEHQHSPGWAEVAKMFWYAFWERYRAVYSISNPLDPINPSYVGRDVNFAQQGVLFENFVDRSWITLQTQVWNLRKFYVDADQPLEADGLTWRTHRNPAHANMHAAEPHWPPCSDGSTGFVRVVLRQITATTDPGEKGQRARMAGQHLGRGGIFEHNGTSWVPVPLPVPPDYAYPGPDVYETRGLARVGDIITARFLNDLRDAINLLRWTFGATPRMYAGQLPNQASLYLGTWKPQPNVVASFHGDTVYNPDYAFGGTVNPPVDPIPPEYGPYSTYTRRCVSSGTGDSANEWAEAVDGFALAVAAPYEGPHSHAFGDPLVWWNYFGTAVGVGPVAECYYDGTQASIVANSVYVGGTWRRHVDMSREITTWAWTSRAGLGGELGDGVPDPDLSYTFTDFGHGFLENRYAPVQPHVYAPPPDDGTTASRTWRAPGLLGGHAITPSTNGDGWHGYRIRNWAWTANWCVAGGFEHQPPPPP